MKNSLSFRILTLAGLSAVVLGFSSCSKDDELQQKPVTEAPSTYNFTNVNYSGQTARLLLLKNLEAEMEKAKTQTVTKAQLMAIFENTANLHTDISTDKRLSDKMASPADKQQVEAWFADIETLSAQGKGYVTDNGIDLKQMVAKTIMGSVFYNRALNDYLDPAKLADDDNSTVTEGNGTEMEHHFDEGFGYFGAARTYNNFTDAEIASPGHKDVNGDGVMDPKSEVNFYFAQTAAKRDAGYADFTTAQTDFTSEIFTEMLKGRHAVSQKNYTQRDEAVNKIRASWDRLIAATVIHYAKAVKTDLDNVATDPSAINLENRAKHWSEMKAYFAMIRYNAGNKLGQAHMSHVDGLLGANSSEVTAAGLDEAIAQLKSSYNF